MKPINLVAGCALAVVFTAVLWLGCSGQRDEVAPAATGAKTPAKEQKKAPLGARPRIEREPVSSGQSDLLNLADEAKEKAGDKVEKPVAPALPEWLKPGTQLDGCVVESTEEMKVETIADAKAFRASFPTDINKEDDHVYQLPEELRLAGDKQVAVSETTARVVIVRFNRPMSGEEIKSWISSGLNDKKLQGSGSSVLLAYQKLHPDYDGKGPIVFPEKAGWEWRSAVSDANPTSYGYIPGWWPPGPMPADPNGLVQFSVDQMEGADPKELGKAKMDMHWDGNQYMSTTKDWGVRVALVLPATK